MFERKHSIWAKTSPEELDEEGSWDPAIFLLGSVRRGHSDRQTAQLADVAEGMLEGVRLLSDLRTEEPIYLSSAITPFEIKPKPQQWTRQSLASARAVRPGDVIIKRLRPVAGAMVPAGVPKLPVDANCFVVRGLSRVWGWWLCYCVNHPPYADYLTSKSGRRLLGRVSLSVLRDWVLPVPPLAFAEIAQNLAELLQKRVLLTSHMAQMTTEVEEFVARLMGATAYESAENEFRKPSWCFFAESGLIESSWLPKHAATEHLCEILHRDPDWQTLNDLLMPELPGRSRFGDSEEPIQYLRLSDVGDMPVVPSKLEPRVPTKANRVLRDPVQPEDVLLSSLGSSPRIACAPYKLPTPVYPVDLWLRLRFRDHAAAYAMVLQTQPVARQMNALARGSAQQFIRPEDIHRLFVPVLPKETLSQWDHSFRSLAQAWQQQENEWKSAISEGWEIFYRAHGLVPTAKGQAA